jgi:UDP-GlcNAc:undecaprenyl-phosphate GlcNAc-1-phosphate transferase
VKSVGLSLLSPLSRSGRRIRQSSVRLQGSKQWEVLWNTLTEFADKLNLCSIRLVVSLPSDHEGYHASWRRPPRNLTEEQWRMELPLTAGEKGVGRLIVSGERLGGSARDLIEKLLDLLQPFESQLGELAGSPAGRHAAAKSHAAEPVAAAL